jgi:hypothetical protein
MRFSFSSNPTPKNTNTISTMRHKANNFRSTVTPSGQIAIVCELATTGHAATLRTCPQSWALVASILRRMEERGTVDLAHWEVQVPARTLLRYLRDTRMHGRTYVHAAVRQGIPADGVVGEVEGRAVRITYRGWGRSLLSPRGHNYKMHINYVDDGKPVPTKLFLSLR